MNIYLFSDASVNKNIKKSVGCFFIIIDNLNNYLLLTDKNFNYVIHDTTSSTQAELLTIKMALDYVNENHYSENIKITLYTDCLNFVNLVTKRKSNDNLKNHKNYNFYNELINIVDSMNIHIY